MKKILFLILFFYILALFQTSFLVHFDIKGIVLNFILISVILIILLTSHHLWLGISAAAIGGFFWDIFSPGPIGFHIFILVILAIFIQIIFKYIGISFRYGIRENK